VIFSKVLARLYQTTAMKKPLCKAGLLLLTALALPMTAQANAPEISPALKKMLGGLPIAGIKDQVQGMVGALSKTSCGNNLTGCYMTQSGPLQLYFFTSGKSQQTLLLVVDKTMAMPQLLGEKAQKVMGETSLSSPIISISTTDYELDNIKMPPALQKVVREQYFNINTLSFSSGVQVAARASLGGPIKLTMQSMGVNTSQLMMRAAVVMPIPSDLAGGAGAGVGMADAVAHGDTMKKAGADALMPEAFVEFQFGPKSSLELNSPKMVLTDATFFINNALTFGYKGNAAFKGAEGKKIIMQFQTPLSPAGAMDLLDFSFRMATPASFTMEDAAHMMVAMATPDGRLAKYGGGFIRSIDTFKGPLLAMTKPLSVVQLRNPEPPTPYVFGDSTKPFPEDMKYFNFVLLGPLADDGPLLKAAGDVRILGQKMGWLNASAGRSGLYGDVGEALTLKLGPLGKVRFKMQATMAVNAGKQDITLLGNFAGQKVEVGMSGSTMKVAVNASCVNPFEIKTQLEITPTIDIAEVFDLQGGVNVDPGKIGGCIGKELEAAYKKISGEFSHLGGYTAKAANQELTKIGNAAADVARKEYENTKDVARNVANKTSNAATSAFNDAGNAFKKLGKKKKHKKGPDPKFAGSVFDWDYYYDNNPDMQKPGVDLTSHWKNSGFAQGRRGSLEFSASYYLNRYPDVASACSSNNLQCALQHWLDYGIEMGRQGSPDFSVVSYMNRYSDVPKTLAPEHDPDALEHWLTSGFDAGRDGRPASTATGPFSAPTRAGGGGGGPWNDAAQCQNLYVIGFRVSSGDRVDGVQFLYSNNQWGAVHGKMKTYSANVILPAGQFIERVNFRSGASIDAVGFMVNTGMPATKTKSTKTKFGKMPSLPEIPGPDPAIKYDTYGMYGGVGGTYATYTVTSGEKLACMSGRSGEEVDQLIFSSTGQR
jgi:hypothetical protein